MDMLLVLCLPSIWLFFIYLFVYNYFVPLVTVILFPPQNLQ